MTRVVVVGNGMAGSRLVHELRRRPGWRDLEVTLIGAEPHAAYNRVLLSAVLAGAATADAIRLAAPDWSADLRLNVRTGVEVAAIDRLRRQVVDGHGERTSYDVLVLATGSRAVVPPIEGICAADGSLRHGVVAFRTLEDCDRILAHAATARRVVVLGGGLLGLEAARGLAGRGLDVEVVHPSSHLMEQQLDTGAGAVLASTLQRLRVRVRLGTTISAVVGEPRVTSVLLDDGTALPADLVVLACGARPETSLARAAGLVVDRGIVVDDELCTSDPHVRAVGECTQHAGQVYGLVAPAWEQAEVLAALLAADGSSARYTGSRMVTRLKAAGVDLAAMGDSAAAVSDVADDTLEVVQFVDPTRGTYKKLVIRDGRLVGAILLGDVATAGTVTQLFDRAADLPADRLGLLFGGYAAPPAAVSPALMPDRATVCRCNGVTKGAITACWLDGADGTDEVVARTRATTGCGTCREAVEGIVDWLAAAGSREKSTVA